jgi:hypothetical protein
MAAALVLLSLSGCSSPSSSPSPPDALPARTVRFGPESFPAGHDWLAIEVTTEGDLPTLLFNGTWVDHSADALGPPDYLTSSYRTPCMVLRAVSAEESLGATGVKPRIHQGTQLRAMDVEEGVVVSNVHSSQSMGLMVPLQRGSGTAHYLIGLSVLNQPWPGDSLQWDLAAAQPFHWRFVGSGTMQCGTEPADFEGGPYTRFGLGLGASATIARDLHQSFDFQGAGLLFVAGTADQEIVSEVQRDGQSVWSQSASGGAVPEPTRTWWVPGASGWEYMVHTFSDASGFGVVGYLAIDGLPPLLVERASQQQATGAASAA